MSVSVELREMMSVLVDNEFGIIEEVAKLRLQPDDVPMHIGASIWQNQFHISPHTRDLPFTHPILSSSEGDRQGTGVGLDNESCLWATIGEAVERYSASIQDKTRLIRAKGTALDGPVLPPEDLIGFSDTQYASEGFPFSRPTTSTQIYWMKGIRYPQGDEVWVPADCALVSRIEPDDTIFDKGYSTGLGAGTIREKAALSALREVIERDAYVCHWLTGSPGRNFDISHVRDIVGPEYHPFLEREDVEMSIIDISTDTDVPCILTMIREKNGKGVASGASCNVSYKIALEKSVLECWHTYNWLIDLNRWTKSAEKEEISEFIDHVSHYLEPSRQGAVDFLMSPTDMIPRDAALSVEALSVRQELTLLIGRLHKLGYTSYFVDVTAPDVAELGWTVVRAIVPGLQPMSAGVGFEHRDTRRLQKFADWKGFTFDQINEDPHPFP